MLTLEQAQQALWQQARPIIDTITLPLHGALGQVAAQTVLAQHAVPPADNSAMDGYALRWAEAEQPLPISQRIAAGRSPEPLAALSAARIFTGGEIPLGADTVVMQENAQLLEDGRVLVKRPEQGANIRPKGQDVAIGQCVVAKGQRLGPIDLALLASQGLAQVSVLRRCKVAVVSTGSELVEPGSALQPGQIFNSNGTLISAALSLLGAAVSSFSLPDDPKQTQHLLARLAAEVDVIITTGGVSAGEEDHVKTSVAALGQVQFWKIAMKPGKPFMFGHIKNTGKATPILGLPGNPVSSFITYALLAKPFVQALQGAGARLEPARHLPVAQAISGGTRDEYLRVENTSQGLVPLANQSSGRLSSLQQAGGIMRLSADTELMPGDTAEYWCMSELLAP